MRRPSPSRTRRILAVVALGLLLALAPATAASAHAALVSSDPADGSIVSEAPRQVSLQFTEGVAVRADGVRVLDASGARVDTGTASADGATVTTSLRSGLDDGSYLVAWRVVSADGHAVRGAFSFAVGERTAIDRSLANRAFGKGDDRRYELAAGALRIVAYLAALGAAGAITVTARLRRPDEPSPLGPLTSAAAALALTAICLQVPVQGALATGQGLRAITEPGVFDLAMSDGVGWSLLVVALGLFAIILTAGLPYDGAVPAFCRTGAVIVPIGFALTGHTRTMSPAVVAYVADVVHLSAAALWFGGVIALGVIVKRRRAEEDPEGAAEAVGRFSALAAIVAGAVIVSGVAMAWILVGGLDALTSTDYGALLIAKVAAVAAIGVGAAWNRFRLVPAVTADPAATPEARWRALRRIVGAEALVMVGVLGITGVLVNVTPAEVAAKSQPTTVEAALGDIRVSVTLDPASAGLNDVHVFLLDAQGRADDRYQEAAVALTQPTADLGPLEPPVVRVGPGHFRVVAVDLPVAGDWNVKVTVRPDRFTEQTATVTIRVR
jgi:copper transport protein